MITKIKKAAIDVKELFKDSWVTSKDFINRHPVYKKLLIGYVIYKLAVIVITRLNTRTPKKRISQAEDKSEDLFKDAMKRSIKKSLDEGSTMKVDDIDNWD